VRKALLEEEEVDALGTKTPGRVELDAQRRFYRDRLVYRNRRLAEADTLWTEADQEYRQELAGLKVVREWVAGEFGGRGVTAAAGAAGPGKLCARAGR